MSEHYRQLTAADRDIYLTLMLEAYAQVREMGIHFDAATTTAAQVTQHLQQHGVWGAVCR